MTLEVPRGGRQPSQVAAARQAVALQRLSGATTPGGSRAQGLISTAAGLALPGAAPQPAGASVIGLATFEDDRNSQPPDGGSTGNVVLLGPYNTIGDISAFAATGTDARVRILTDGNYMVSADATIRGLSAGDLCTMQLIVSNVYNPILLPWDQYVVDANVDGSRAFLSITTPVFFASPATYSFVSVNIALYGPAGGTINYCAVHLAQLA